MDKRHNISNARRLRREMTDAEKLLWSKLRAREFNGYKFRRQHSIGNYIVDFVCIQAKLVIEADGGQHAEQQSYDKARDDFLQQQGYKVLRFWNHEILSMSNAVFDSIWREVQDRHPHPSPLPPAGEGAEQKH